jgi:hypothetical protein
MPRNISTAEAVRRAGCTYRQLDYWCRTFGLCGADREGGAGHPRAFTATEVRIARALRELGEAGVNVGIYARYIIATMTALPGATHLLLMADATGDGCPAVGAYLDAEELAAAVLTSPGPSIAIQVLKSGDIPTQEIP